MALAPDVVANAQASPVAWKGEIERSERIDSCGLLGSFSPGSAATAQQAAADLHQVADAQLPVAVLVEHRAEQAAAAAALLADVPSPLSEDAAGRLRSEKRGVGKTGVS